MVSIQSVTGAVSAATEQEESLIELGELGADSATASISIEALSSSTRTLDHDAPPGKIAFYRYLHRHRSIDWRWQRAHDLLKSEESINPLYDDEQVERIYRYLALTRDDPLSAADTDLSLAFAEQLFHEGGEREGLLRAWLLTELSFPEIAGRIDLPEEVVNGYASMFFDVRDRRDHAHWMIMHAIRLHDRTFGSFEEAEFATWQFEALDGAQALEELLTLARLRPCRDGESIRRIDEQILRIWKYRVFVSLVTTPWITGNPAAWHQMYFEQRRLELDRRRQGLVRQSISRKTRQAANSCSTRNSYGSGDAAGIIEEILLSIRPCRSEGSEDLLRFRGNACGHVGRIDDDGTNALGP